jgi:uncharacterized membrane protein SpoIIM required for sporulation
MLVAVLPLAVVELPPLLLAAAAAVQLPTSTGLCLSSLPSQLQPFAKALAPCQMTF